VVTARAAYAKALIQFEQMTGTLLERNNIDLSEAVQGEIQRAPNIPGTPAAERQDSGFGIQDSGTTSDRSGDE
jgi:hypothetical protein